MIVVSYTRIFHILYEVNIHIKTDYIARSMFGSTRKVVVLICVWQIFLFVYLSFVFCSRSRKFAVEESSCVNVITYFRAVFVFFCSMDDKSKLSLSRWNIKINFQWKFHHNENFKKSKTIETDVIQNSRKKVRIDMHKF